ncbi:MAG: magnesium and cobalt transport protein CorA [Gemmatimonas sp.]
MDSSAADPKHEPGVVAAAVYCEGRRIRDITVDEAREWAQRPGHIVWIGLYEPNMRLLARLQQVFDLNPLAIEDAAAAHQRPKLEQYGDCLFVVARTAQMVKGRIAFGETDIFVGKGYVVSVRHGASCSYGPVRERAEAAPQSLAKGEDFVLYALLDFIVDQYFPVIQSIGEIVEDIEDRVLDRTLTNAEIERLYMLRRDLQRLRNAAAPLVEVCRKLEQAEVPALDPAMQPLFRDVSDHIRHVEEEIDAHREILAFAFEASMMLGQAEQTGVTRKLAAWAAILAVPTAVAGIYGMNFDNMPELRWAYGYYAVLAAIVALCVGLYSLFRRYRWL